MKEKVRKQSFYDDYGFKTDQWTLKISKYLKDQKQVQQQNKKWYALIPIIKTLKNKDNKQLRNLVRQGIADKLRPQIWSLIIDKPFKSYADVVNKQQRKQIDLDINRTIPTNKNIKSMIANLKEVLNAIAFAFPQMGYCQGLNFITATILLKLNNQIAYNVLFHVIQYKRHLELLSNLQKIHNKIYAFQKLLNKHYPKVSKHLKQHQLQPLLYSASWFITLFTSVFPCNYSFRIIQLYLIEGDKVLYRAALQVIKQKKKRLKKMQTIQELLAQLKNFDELDLLNQNKFFQQMFLIKVSKKEIQELQQEYQKQKQNQGV